MKIKNIAKEALNFPSTIRAYWKDELTIRRGGVELHYATKSPTAKQWFYPRYASGSRFHEPPISQLIMSRLTPNSIFYDVGANLGYFTVLAANLCKGQRGEVHSFELDPSLIPLIRDSVRLNKNTGAVYVNCTACADQTASFFQFKAAQENNPSTNQIVVDGVRSERRIHTQTMTMTIDHYWKQTGALPDLVKMDIEGAEALAVPGMLDLITEKSPEIILEVHPAQVCSLGSTPSRVVETLQEAETSYTVFEIKSYREVCANYENALTPLNPKVLQRDTPVVLFFTDEDRIASIEDVVRDHAFNVDAPR